MPTQHSRTGTCAAGAASNATAAAKGDARVANETTRRLLAMGIGLAILQAGLTPIVGAQELDEIVVTAQKREQSLQQVGISITAVQGDDLRDRLVVDTRDLYKVAAGVMLDTASGGNVSNNLTIRGVSQSDFSSNQESPNSMYLDEIYMSSPGSANFPLYDLDRVEVLRGPQGTLFGRASSGGLVHMISKGPTEEVEGYLEVGAGRFDQYHVEGAVGGPISETVRGRIAGRWSRADGWFKNTLAGQSDAMEERDYGFRAQLEADVTDSFTARLAVNYDRSPKHVEGIYKPTPFYVDPSGQPAPIPANLDPYGTGPGTDFTGERNDFKGIKGAFTPGFVKKKRFMPSLYLEWQNDSFTATSITNYTDFSYGYLEDCDGDGLNLCSYAQGQDLEQWSQELRFNGSVDQLTWTTGLYYLNVDQSYTQFFAFPAAAGTDFAFSDFNPVHQKLESYAVFGQVEYKFTPEWTLLAGLRYTHDRKDFDSKVFFDELGNGFNVPPGTGSTIFDPPLLGYDFSKATVGSLAKAKANLWSGKLEIDYHPNEDTLFYVSFSRGVKGPGFNTNIGGTTTLEQTPFGDEHMWAYEVGSKLEVFDRRLRLNTSVFYYDYHDFQGFTFQGLTSLVSNFKARFTGAEMELRAVPMDGLDLDLAVAWLDTKVDDVSTIYNGVQDQESIKAPEWTVNGAVRKTFPVGSGELGLQWSFNYIDDHFASLDNNPATLISGGNFMHSAQVSYALPDQGWEVTAFVD
ncbi:MAG: TonB-dependent receptor, partial [Dehalococcoidia bacterium]